MRPLHSAIRPARGSWSARASRRLFIARGNPLGARLDRGPAARSGGRDGHAGGGKRWRAAADPRLPHGRGCAPRGGLCTSARCEHRIPLAMPCAGSSGSASSPRACTGMRAPGSGQRAFAASAGIWRPWWDRRLLGTLARGHRPHALGGRRDRAGARAGRGAARTLRHRLGALRPRARRPAPGQPAGTTSSSCASSISMTAASAGTCTTSRPP